MPELKQGEGEQADLAFYCDREVAYYKQFVKDGRLDTDKLAAYGFNERQIPQIQVIATEQGWIGKPAAEKPKAALKGAKATEVHE